MIFGKGNRQKGRQLPAGGPASLGPCRTAPHPRQQIPYSTEQGIIFTEQGISAQEQGIFLPQPKSSLDDVFGTHSYVRASLTSMGGPLLMV
jgi:hypothetical protein